MEENNSTELEEGEACYYQEEEGGNDNIDPDVALSYIDEKIQNVLGHFQKDFEGGVTAENLGAKFGGYGSFLPTYERSPSSLSRQRSPERSSMLAKSQNNNLSAEVVPRNLRSPATAPPSSRLKAAQCNTDKLHNAKFPSGDLSIKQVNQEPQFCSNPIAENPTRGGTLIKSGKGANQRLLKVRIKMGSDNNTKMNSALYSGLGLEGSPSTTFSSSSQESGGFPPVPAETTYESPAYILRVMTSLPVPCSDLISPLNESLLSLIKEVVPKDNKPAENVRVSSGKNTVSVDQLVTLQGDVMLSKPKRRKSESRDKSPMEVNNGNSMIFYNKMTIPVTQEVKNEMLDDEVSLHYNSEKASLSSTGNICGEPRKIAAKTSEVITEANNVKVRRNVISNSVKESPLKPMSGPDYDTEVEKRQKITIVKAGEHAISTSQVAEPFYSTENGLGKGDNVFMPPKDRFHVAKNKEESLTGKADSLKLKVGYETPCHEKSENDFPFRDEKPLVRGKKKSKGCQSDDKVIISGKDRLRSVPGIAGKDKKSSSHDIPKKKVLALKSRKDISGLGNGVDVSGSSNGGCNHLEAPSAGRQRDASSTFPLVENDSALANSRETNVNGVISNSLSGAHVKGAVDIAAGAPTTEMVPAAASLLENWVCCDLCEKWRLLPNGIRPEDLPKKWMCSMLDWLPRMNSCDIHEDVTTGIMRGLIPCPGFESQNHANGSIFGVTSSVQHLGQNPPNANAVATNGQGKSKLGQKEMLRKNKGIPVKSRSLNNMSPPPAGRNSLGMGNLPESKSQDLALGESTPKQKENLSIGDSKMIKEKNKRKSDQFEFKTSKRAKRDGNSDIEVCSKAIDLGTPKLTLVRYKGHSNERGSANEVKHGLGGNLTVSVKNLSDQAKVSTNCTSMNLKESGSVKKKKRKGSQENQIDGEPYHCSMRDCKLITEEETDQQLSRTGKKSRFSDVIGDTSSGDGNSRSKKEGKAPRDLSTEIKKPFNGGVEEVRHPSKNRKQWFPKQATSSSSMVSGSQKSRVNYEVQGSPVESVSSSPLRIINSAKYTSVGHDVPTTENALNGVLPVVDNAAKGSDKKVKKGGKLSGIVMKKESRGFHSGSLESGCLQNDAKPSSRFGNGQIPDRNTDYPQHGEFPVNHTSHDDGVYMKSGSALRLQKNGNISSLISNVKGRNYASDSDTDKVKALETAGENVTQHLNKGKGHESLVKANQAPPFGEVHSHVNYDSVEKNLKNHTRRDLSKQNKHAQSDGRIDNHYSDYGLESPSENTCPDSNCRVEAAQMSAESMSSKEILFLHPGEGGKQGAPSRDSQLVGQRNICNGLPVDTAGNSDPAKASLRNKKNGASNGECLTSEIDAKDAFSSNPSRANESVQTAGTVLKEAEKLRDLADRLKGTNFGFEGNESYFEAAVKFLQGASLLESGNGESSKRRDMTPLQVYSTAAKLFKSCAAEFERCQELSAAALAYKCMEVAYMRVVNCKYVSLSRDRHELQATLQQGESPSSSASDIDYLNNQAVADRSNLTKGAGSHAVGNHIVVARNCPSFVRLLDFTQDVNLAMEASRKSQIAFSAANGIMKGSQNKEHIISSLKKVIDFSFQDIDGLVNLVQLARKAISIPGFKDAKG